MSQGHVIIPLGAVNPLASGCAQATNASKVGGLRSKNTEVPKAPDPTSAVLRESETHETKKCQLRVRPQAISCRRFVRGTNKTTHAHSERISQKAKRRLLSHVIAASSRGYRLFT